MATLLRRASLRRAIASAASAATSSCPESYRQGICGSTFHCRDFASKAKKKSKSSGTDSGEENMSKKDLALHQAIDQITTSFGKGAIMWLGRSEGHREVPVVSTGSFSLDLALGIGGLPKGRVIEVYGPEASGKTTLALHVIAEAQKLGSGGYCAFIDAEHALDPTLAESIGVDTSNLLLSQPDSAEQALSLVDTLIRSGSVDVVVVDSVAALVPKTELDGEMGDAHVALQARLMSQALRKLSHSLSLSQTILLFINQIRSKVQTFGGGFGGPQEVTSGGNALKFYASVRLNIRRIGLVKKGEEAHAASAILNFGENCTPEILTPYLDGIVSKLLVLLQNGKQMLQEGALTALASVADSSQDHFKKYYDAVMPYLKVILMNATDKSNRMLCAKSMECISLVGMAVGKDKFRDDAKQVMEVLMALQGTPMETDAPITSYMFAGLCQAMQMSWTGFSSLHACCYATTASVCSAKA